MDEYRYGDNHTFHNCGEVNIERDPKTGEVVAVWFRCMMLPFTDDVCDTIRAEELKTYKTLGSIKAIVFHQHPSEKE